MPKTISVPVKTAFDAPVKINSELTRCKCYVMALGKNRNKSYFSRQSVESALSTIKNIPVVAFVSDDGNGTYHVRGHENVLELRDGSYQWRSVCVPYGVVPADAEFSFADVTESDGTVATYLVSDVVLWTGRYPEIVDCAYSKDCMYHQSMEIKVADAIELEDDKDYFDIRDFNFSALCLLGKSDDPDFDVEPCFPSSAIYPYVFDKQFETLMSEFKFELSNCFENKNNKEDGGEKMTIEQETENVEFEAQVEDTAVEETPVVAEEQPEQAETFESHEEATAQPVAEEFSFTYGDKRRAIEEALPKNDPINRPEVKPEEPPVGEPVVEEPPMEEVPAVEPAPVVVGKNCYHYYLCDFDDKYAYVERYDCASEECVMGRFAYVLNMNEKTATITGMFEEMLVKWLTPTESDVVDRMRGDYAAYQESHSYENSEVEELRAFKAARLEIDKQNAVNEVFAKFADLNGNEAFELLKADAMNIDIDVLEEKCFAVRGRTMKPVAAKAKENNEVIVKQINNHDTEVYGGLFAQYGYSNK